MISVGEEEDFGGGGDDFGEGGGGRFRGSRGKIWSI